MYTIQDILAAAAVPTGAHTANGVTVRMTAGNQVVDTYAQLLRFVAANPDYQANAGEKAWEVHHIFEALDVQRIAAVPFSPAYEQQICVLLPRRAHHRINSLLRRENPTKLTATAAELTAAYRGAYANVGNYCGSSEGAIAGELTAIAGAVMKNLLDARNAALLAQARKLREELDKLSRQIIQSKSLQRTLIQQSSPGALEVAGFYAQMLNPVTAAIALVSPQSQRVIGGGVNLLNPAERPGLEIWDKAEMFGRLTLQALARGDTAGAAVAVTDMQAHFIKAQARLTAWRDGIPLAGRRAQLLIGAVAFVTVVALIGIEIAGAAATTTAAGTTAATGTAEAASAANKVRIGVEAIVNATDIAGEAVGEEMVEEGVEQIYHAAVGR